MLSRIKFLLSKLYTSVIYLLIPQSKKIVLNSWIETNYGILKNRNLGDELSYHLIKELTNKTIIDFNTLWKGFYPQNLLFIGSLVEDFVTPQTIIWGSGAISGKKNISHKPYKVCAVRGKLTRDYLLKQNIECPEVYGDPALLLPLVYTPKVKKKYKLGIIPHIVDQNENSILRLSKLDKNIKIINFSNYKDWHSVIDQINECHCIISSSLHGLIISDAYKIPNIWIKVSDKIIGGNFKYLDYFSGVGRICLNPVLINENTTIEELMENLQEYTPITFDYKPFIEASPVSIINLKH